MPKRRREVPRQLQKALIAECSGKCSVPSCKPMKNLEFHHIDGNPALNEIARAAVFLASEDASFIAGIELFIDGGTVHV